MNRVSANINIIYLWGFMGSGKSSIGRMLARMINYDFLDLDTMMEESQGISVSRIFDYKGESYFRELESSSLKNIAKSHKRTVLSTGGGTPCFFDNADLMNKTGVTIYLDVSEKVLKSRLLSHENRTRPLLINEDWKQTLELLKKRQEYYQKAQLKVNNNEDTNQCVQSIIMRLREMEYNI